MVGRTGTRVTIRHLPHHDDVIEVFGTDGKHLGSAQLAEAASAEQIRALKAARTASARRLRADLKAAEKLRRERFKAQTVAGPAERSRTPARGEAAGELEGEARRDRRQLARPELIPHGPAPEHWVQPANLAQQDGERDEN
jgi:putative transposase